MKEHFEMAMKSEKVFSFSVTGEALKGYYTGRLNLSFRTTFTAQERAQRGVSSKVGLSCSFEYSVDKAHVVC